MIEVDHLTKFYGTFPAVSDVSFRVEKGEIMGLLGPNGAGKTTTMRVLTCHFPATSGNARVAGFDVDKDSMEVRKRLGYLPENVPLYHEMRTDQYLHFVGELKGIPGRERKRAVDKVVAECGLNSVYRRQIRKLSKGFRQRVGLAQALLGDPEVLILDEPTVGLDPMQVIEVRNLILAQAKERTVVFSTHILDNVEKICDSVVIIHQGKVLAADTLANLRGSASKSFSVHLRYAGDGPLDGRLKEQPGVKSVVGGREGGDWAYHIETTRDREVLLGISRHVTEAGGTLLELKNSDLTLEEVFRNLVAEEKAL